MQTRQTRLFIKSQVVPAFFKQYATDASQQQQFNMNNPTSQKMILELKRQKLAFVEKIKSRAPASEYVLGKLKQLIFFISEELLNSVKWYLRPFMKAKIQEVREISDEFATVPEPDVNKISTTPKSLYGNSELTKTSIKSKSLLLRIGGYYSQEGQVRKGLDFMWDMLNAHVSKFDEAGIYKGMWLHVCNYFFYRNLLVYG